MNLPGLLNSSVSLLRVDMELCKAYSMGVDKTVAEKYSERNQPNPAVRIPQSITGKLGEIAAYQWIRYHGLPCTPPDFKIYRADHKSYAADLLIKGVHPLHVKSQGIERARNPKYGLSWVFTKDDPVIRSADIRERIIFLLVYPDHAEVCAYMPVAVLNKLQIYSEPALESQRKEKLVVYYKDIPGEFRYREER